jgi:hypothetical protein
VVEDQTVPFDLLEETDLTIHIILARALAMENHHHADLSLDGKGVNGAPIREEETAEADFLARPPAGW